jgi:succinoglycan biosynthesis protein ExoA
VTVVLPVRNEGEAIEAVLSDLLAQDFDPERLEVLVVDGASTDDTKARAQAVSERDPRVRVLDNPARLSSAARAAGAAAARGRFVAYVDGHCRVRSRAWLRDMDELFERTGAACLARPQPLVASKGGAVARAIVAARTSPFGHGLGSEIYGDREGPASPVSSGAAYRREVFERVGTFDAAFDACEDVEFNWRVWKAGLPCVTSPRLAVEYEARRGYGALFRQMRRYGIGRARLAKKHPGSLSLATLVPLLFTLGVNALALVAVLVATGAPPAGAWATLLAVLSGVYALYLLLALGFALAASRGPARASAPLVALAFPVIHLGLGTGIVSGLLRPLPRTPP